MNQNNDVSHAIMLFNEERAKKYIYFGHMPD